VFEDYLAELNREAPPSRSAKASSSSVTVEDVPAEPTEVGSRASVLGRGRQFVARALRKAARVVDLIVWT
jgi:hypothetical protein